VTLDDQGVGMMGEPIKGGTGQQVVAKDLRPFFKGAVTGD
jgi:hypothetical protein